MAQSDDLAVGRIAGISVLLVLTIVGAAVVSIVLKDWLPLPADTIDATPLTALARSNARLLSAPQPLRQQERKRKLERLHSSGWVDQAQGIAHIPIDAAMALIAERGEADSDSAKDSR